MTVKAVAKRRPEMVPRAAIAVRGWCAARSMRGWGIEGPLLEYDRGRSPSEGTPVREVKIAARSCGDSSAMRSVMSVRAESQSQPAQEWIAHSAVAIQVDMGIVLLQWTA